MRFILATALAVSCSASGQGQVRPPELASVMALNKDNASVTYVDQLTAEQKLFYWKDTSRNEKGYWDIEAAREYLDTISLLLPRMTRRETLALSPFSQTHGLTEIPQLAYLGEFVESEHRANLFFQDQAMGLVMLTIFDYVADGSKLSIISEFLNVEVGAAKGILSLVRSAEVGKGLWKLSWLAGKTQYEFYVTDNLGPNRSPLKKPEQILRLASTLVKP